MPGNLPPDRVAAIDQGVALAGAELDKLAAVLERLTGAVGGDQALADLIAYISREYSPPALAMLTALAVRRFSRHERPGGSSPA